MRERAGSLIETSARDTLTHTKSAGDGLGTMAGMQTRYLILASLITGIVIIIAAAVWFALL